MMLLLINGTNREGSRTQVVMNFVEGILKELNENFQSLRMEDCSSILTQNDFDKNPHPHFSKLQDQMLIPSKKFLIISPEYNGSYPGILKLLIDNSEPKKVFKDKKAGLIGVSAGRAGNLRGMDHLRDSLNHMACHVMPQTLPISQIQTMIKEGVLKHEATEELIRTYVNNFLAY